MSLYGRFRKEVASYDLPVVGAEVIAPSRLTPLPSSHSAISASWELSAVRRTGPSASGVWAASVRVRPRLDDLRSLAIEQLSGSGSDLSYPHTAGWPLPAS